MITQAVAALFNACWQGLAIVAVTSVALRFFQRSSAATRYAVWFAALGVVAALPAVDFALAGVAPAPQTVAIGQAAHFTIVRTGEVSYSYAKPHSSHKAASVQPPTTTIGYAVEQTPAPGAQLSALAAATAARIGAMLSAVATPIFFAWLFFSSLMLYRLGFAYARLRRVKRDLAPLADAGVDRLIADSRRPVVVGIASDLTMPCVLGFARPAIALPAALAAELSREDLERIVLHEHAHVRRWDDVANALQLIVQAVMCLNPAVHLIGRSLNVEREIACDDFAVEPLAERVQYAKCLTHIALNGFSRARALPAPGFFFNRKQLLVRVERLLERGHNGSTTIAAAARYALAGLALVAIAVARVQLPVIAATNVGPTTNVGPATNVGPTFMVGHAKSAAVSATSVGHATNVGPTFMVGHAKSAAVSATSLGSTTNVGPTFMVGHAHTALHAARFASAITFANAFHGMQASHNATFSHYFAGPTLLNRHANDAVHVAAASIARIAASEAAVHIASLAPTIAARVAAFAPSIAARAANPSGSDFLDALAAAGYRNLSVDDLVRMKNVGVDGGLIDAAVRYSGSRPSVETLVRMASVGVDADFLNHLQASGYPRMGLEDVVRIRAIGVDADYVRLLRSKGIGGSGLSVDDLIRMKSVGVE